MSDLYLLREFIKEALLDEAKKKRKNKRKKKRKNKRPGNKNYYKGTRKSNKKMAYEIEKCKGPNPPKSCYDYWSADKEYDKSKKGKKK